MFDFDLSLPCSFSLLSVLFAELLNFVWQLALLISNESSSLESASFRCFVLRLSGLSVEKSASDFGNEGKSSSTGLSQRDSLVIE